MTDRFSIRAAEISDVAFLASCAREAYAQYVEAIGREPAPMVFDFASRLNEIPIEVIEQNGKAAGYIVWYLRENDLFLESIAISSKFQGKSLARKAMNYLERKAKETGKSTIKLYTNEKMTGNLTLYPHLGFEETERRQEDGFNRVYFRKDIR